ncbi:Lysophospholipase, alpha-beta hydrolase superfamily [Catalinimonas alkaloidigena]|uniref:Lysophospholipase, alpha-beta hydrolase superfamily n=1 Tax=Catalinimonas alkaloidigena TaxID=1075417 RepID=A0A1G9KR84_9BACT|nr:Lysophospholipase, alpha-beta hydrolase superfamily [Catalinimonas alkaloidigena]
MVGLNSKLLKKANYTLHTPVGESKATALLIHGLNVRPDSLGWLIDQLTARGIRVVNVQLRGHSKAHCPHHALHRITWEDWVDDLQAPLQEVRNRPAQPCVLIGYSMGALVGLEIAHRYHVTFDRYLLLAPPIQINALSRRLLPLCRRFGRVVLPSFTPKAYRVYPALPIGLFHTLATGIRSVAQRKHPGPLTILIDPCDELVSFAAVKAFAIKHRATLKVIAKKIGDCRYGHIKHLIVDEASLGPATDLLRDYLNRLPLTE